MQDTRLDEAFDAWVAAQRAALDVVHQGDFGVPESTVDLAEGYRWVTRLARLALEWFVEKSDPLHPQLFTLQDEYRKLLVDNPDVHYLFCVLDDTLLVSPARPAGSVRLPRHDLRHSVRPGPRRRTYGHPDPDPHRRVRARSPRRGGHPHRARGFDAHAAAAVSVVLEPGMVQLAIRETHFVKSPDRLARLRVELVPEPGEAVPPPLLSSEELAPKLETAAMFLTFVGSTALQMWRDAATNLNTFGGQAGAADVQAQEDEVRSTLQRRDDVPRRTLPARARRSARDHRARARQAVPLLGSQR